MIKYYITRGNMYGKRLFKHNTENNTVLQIVIHQGKKKKGRANTFGIYRISEATLVNNYLCYLNRDYLNNIRVSYTTENLFNHHLNNIINKLKQ